MVEFRVKKIHPEAVVPAKQDRADAGWDLITVESYTLQPGERHLFATGLTAEFPMDYVAILKDRSSLGSKGIHILAGVIDAAYRGEWKIILLNTSSVPYVVTAGDRIAQCLFLPVPDVSIQAVDQLSDTVRGAGGFGSTGK